MRKKQISQSPGLTVRNTHDLPGQVSTNQYNYTLAWAQACPRLPGRITRGNNSYRILGPGT